MSVSKTPSRGWTCFLLTCAVVLTGLVLTAGGLLAAATLWPSPPTASPTAPPLAIVSATHRPAATQPPAATTPPMVTASPPPPSPTVAPATSTPSPAPAAFDPQDYELVEIATGLDRPLTLVHAGDGTGRLFIVEQPGTIRLLQDGALLPDPFLDLTDRVNDRSNEQGLLGLAFPPDYAATGAFFVNYTDVNGDTVIARFQVSSDPDRADPASETILLQIAQPYPNHNGGDIAFGPDGYLYIASGDGGSANDPQNNAQDLQSLLGKMLRIDVRAAEPAGGRPYAIPPSNPLAGRADARPEIWAYGLRNPWRFAFDRATGDLYIADVGQNTIEEVNFQPADSPGGENYGWRPLEGTRPTELDPVPDGTTPPVTEYTHAEGGCSVTGGYVYRGAALPALVGRYFFGDYCSGIIWVLARDTAGAWQRQVFAQAGFQISAFGEDEAGELYILNHRGGGVYQVAAAP